MLYQNISLVITVLVLTIAAGVSGYSAGSVDLKHMRWAATNPKFHSQVYKVSTAMMVLAIVGILFFGWQK